MAKKIKSKWLGARVDDDESAEVAAYLEVADGLDMAELIRKAVQEYMKNHPVGEKAQV